MPERISFVERRNWASRHTEWIPMKADLLGSALVSAGALLYYRLRNDDAAFWEYLAIIGISVLAVGIVAPLVIFAVNLVKARAAILAERLTDCEHRRAVVEHERELLLAEKAQDAERRPKPGIWFANKGNYWHLHVRNVGAAAVFHANVRAIRAVPTQGVGNAQRLRWEKAKGTASKIVTGDEDYCVIGIIESSRGPIFKVEVSLICDSGDGPGHYPYMSYWRADWFPEAQGLEMPPPWAQCELTLTADPEIAGGPIIKRFQLGPLALYEEGEDGYDDERRRLASDAQ